MAQIDSSNQSYVTLVNNMTSFFNGGNWQYMYDRVAGSKAYLLNQNNASGILYSYSVNGNPQTTVSSYAGMLLWYYAAYYGNLYPLPAPSQTNCAGINTAIINLQAEIAASDKVYVNDGVGETHNARTLAINNLSSQFNSLYTNLSCDTYLASVAQQQAASEQQAALTASQQSAVSTYNQTAGASGGGTSYAIIIAVAVAGVIGFMVIKKMNKK